MMLVSSKTSKRQEEDQETWEERQTQKETRKDKENENQTNTKNETRNKKHDFLRANRALKSSQLRKARSTSSTHQDTIAIHIHTLSIPWIPRTSSWLAKKLFRPLSLALINIWTAQRTPSKCSTSRKEI
jgi:hypothetical protein